VKEDSVVKQLQTQIPDILAKTRTAVGPQTQ